MSLRTLPLRIKLIGGFILVATVSAFISIIGHINIQSLRQADWNLYHYDTEPQPDLAYISVSFQKIRVALRDFLAALTPNQKANFLSQAEALTHSLDQAIGKFNRANLSPDERAAFDQFLQARASYLDFEARIIAAGKANRPQDGWTILWSDSYGEVAKTVLGSIATIEQMKVADARQAIEANMALASRSSTQMIIAIVVGLALALGTGDWLTVSITRPLNQAVLNLTSASREILATTTEQASGAREQAAAVAETATTADEITQTAQQAAQRANSMGICANLRRVVGKEKIHLQGSAA